MVPVKLRTPDAVVVPQWLTVDVREERREELNVVLRLLLPLPPLLDPLERALRVRLRMGVALPLGTGVTVLFLVEVAAREGTAAEGRAAGLALDVFVVVLLTVPEDAVVKVAVVLALWGGVKKALGVVVRPALRLLLGLLMEEALGKASVAVSDGFGDNEAQPVAGALREEQAVLLALAEGLGVAPMRREGDAEPEPLLPPVPE